jgi:hypothetical protein
VNLHVSGNEGNPLVKGAPGITYDFHVSLASDGPQGTVSGTITGTHDGFPAFEILIERPETNENTQTVIYGSNPTGSPLSLFPGVNQVSVNQNFTVEAPGRKRH